MTQAWLIFGGAYGNLEATRALFAAADELNIGGDHIICTGDVAAYCADPNAVVDLIRARNIAVVMGNCEESLGLGRDDCGCGFEQGSACLELSQNWHAFNSAQLTQENRTWMAALARRIVVQIGGFTVAVIHGGVGEIAKFIFASSPDETFHQEFGRANCDIIVAGHSGLPFTRSWPHRLWHNAGVIGMPANDATPRTWFSVLTPEPGGLTIDHLELTYDYSDTAKKMIAQRLPAGYAECLNTGLWPSRDVLPEGEKRQTGRPLSYARLHWTPSNYLDTAASAP